MAEFGQPQRTATSDANEGIVNPPSVKTESRSTVSRSVSNTARENASLDEGVASIGATLGGALSNFLETEATNINEQRELAAAARQGVDIAVNTDDLHTKRTGWKKAVFGQSAEYRGAQQQAVKNSLSELYLQQASEVDQYAGELPEDYGKRLQDGLDKALEPHARDPETRAMITAAYAENTQKLTSEQWLAHKAYTQTENKREFETSLRLKFDIATVETSQTTTPEQAQARYKELTGLFDPASKPETMDEIAWRASMNAEKNLQLRNGNFGAYNVSKHADWQMNAADKLAEDQAIAVYDSHFQRKVQVAYAEADLLASNAVTMEDAVAAIEAGISSVQQLSEVSSGTEAAQLALLNGEDSLVDFKNRLIKEASKSVAKAEEAEQRQNEITASVRMEMQGKSSNIGTKAYTKSEEEEGLDSVLRADVSRLAQLEDGASTVEVMDAILENPKVAQSAYTSWDKSRINSPMVTSLIKTAMGGILTQVGEDGLPTPEARQRFVAASQFAESSKFADNIGEANWQKFLIMQEGLEAGFTSDMIKTNTDEFMKNQGQWENFGIQIPKIEVDGKWKAQSRVDYVSGIVRRIGGFNPSPAEAAQFTEQWKAGIIIHGGDMAGGEKYLSKMIHGLGVKYNGTIIPNAAHLKSIDVGDKNYSLEQIINGMQRPDVNAMSPFISMMFGGTTDNVPRVDLEGVQFKLFTRAGSDGVWISSPEAQQPVHISMSDLQDSGRIIAHRDSMARLATEQKAKAKEKRLRASIQNRMNGPL